MQVHSLQPCDRELGAPPLGRPETIPSSLTVNPSLEDALRMARSHTDSTAALRQSPAKHLS